MRRGRCAGCGGDDGPSLYLPTLPPQLLGVALPAVRGVVPAEEIIAMAAIHCKNPRCPDRATPLATTDGATLSLGRVRVAGSVVLICSACGRRERWVPMPRATPPTASAATADMV